MRYIVESGKDVATVARDLAAAVKRRGFGLLQVYDLKAKLREKGINFSNECQVLEVCNPQQAAQVLSTDMSISMALPCRISVYEENGVTKIGTILPSALLAMFPGAGDLEQVAEEVERDIILMIAEAR
ncbi:MAG: hypothetical protein A2521_12715 [Deltaproteobacteria bacterium RIFOXYD12_FULL_57_12]|nr:MAG: hypothetical protein A2521_12715 [Deltaproteobacteria bacterium RIFOXYD12_FULL_57_12]